MVKISQREARRLQKLVGILSREKSDNAQAWAREYVGGVNISTLTVTLTDWHIAMTARKLGHALVVLPTQNGKAELMLYAVKP